MPTTTPSPLLLALREGTRDCHKTLEARLPFFSPCFDSTDYRRLLQAYYGFHAPGTAPERVSGRNAARPQP